MARGTEQENPAVAPRADLEVVGVEPEQCYVTLEGRMTRQGLLPAFCVRAGGGDHQVRKSKGSVDGIPLMEINFPILYCDLVMVHRRSCWLMGDKPLP